MTNKELAERYPWLRIGDKSLEVTDDIVTWADIIPAGWLEAFGDLLFEDLNKAIIDSFPDGVPDDFCITEIKEKWGRLCIYTTHETRQIRDVLMSYEYLSSFVCISCGVPYPFSHMTYNGWILPLCENCFIKNHKYEEKEDAYEEYLQTVLKDSISVFQGPEKKITLETYSTTEDSNITHISVLPTWKKIITRYTQKKLI